MQNIAMVFSFIEMKGKIMSFSSFRLLFGSVYLARLVYRSSVEGRGGSVGWR